MKEIDLKELAEFDGNGGKPAYVAYRGEVFDVGGSKRWKGGVHMKRHHAGEDLSEDMEFAPHGPEMLRRCPQVGILKKTGSS